MLHELDKRESDGISVVLTWDDMTGDTILFLKDKRSELDAFFTVDPAKARDAFLHPFPYFERCKKNAERYGNTYSVRV